MEPPPAKITTEEEYTRQKPIILFGRNILEIKCFRDSFICGFCCGFIGGMACFLGTSKTLFSTHIGFASIWLGVFGYWFPCRYKYETDKFLSSKIIHMRKDIIKLEEFESKDE